MHSTTIFLQAAKKLGLKTKRLTNTPVFIISNGKKILYSRNARLSNLSAIGSINCKEKNITKNFLRQNGICTPKWMEFYKGSTTADVRKHAGKLNFPVVVKPFKGTHGEDITVGVKNINKVVSLVRKLQKKMEL